MLTFESFKTEAEAFLHLPRGALNASSWIGEPPEWDSIAHAEWIVAIEENHDVLFDIDDFASFRDLQSVYDCLVSRLGN